MPSNNSSAPFLHRVADQPIVQLVAYYLILVAAVLLIQNLWPQFPGLFSPEASGGPATGAAPSDEEKGPWRIAAEGAVAMTAAFLLMLPTTGIYLMIRRKRG